MGSARDVRCWLSRTDTAANVAIGVVDVAIITAPSIAVVVINGPETSVWFTDSGGGRPRGQH